MRARLGLLLLLSPSPLACRYESSTIQGPPLDGVGSTLLFVRSADGLAGWAFERPVTEPRYLPVRPDEGLQLWAVDYGCSLSALGLVEGQLPFLAAGTGAPLPPLPSRVLASSLSSAGQAPWAEQALPPELLQVRLAIARRTLCELYAPSFRGDLLSVQGSVGTNVAATVAAGGGRWLLSLPQEAAAGRDQYALFDGLARVEPLDLGLPPAIGAFRSAGGTIRLFLRGGAILAGDLEAGFTSAGRTTSGSGRVRIIASGSSAEPPEIFTLSDDGVVDHFDGARWRVLARLPRAHNWSDLDLIWTGPGEALAVVADSEAVHRITLTGSTAVPLPFPDPRRPVSLAAQADGSVLVGTLAGDVLRYAARALEPLGTPFGASVLGFAPFLDGFLVAGAEGFVSTWTPALGYCSNGVYAGGDVRPVVPLDAGRFLLVARSSALSAEVALALLSPETGPLCAGERR